jgi:hypothetical protein
VAIGFLTRHRGERVGRILLESDYAEIVANSETEERARNIA